ncbi:MAG: relaxase, partial [Firmicutes bacterium]|nr:relaxase [Bacillota bacterium]
GFERWAKVQNLKSLAKTLIYLQEHNLDDFGLLQEKTASATARFYDLSDRIKKVDAALTANADLQRHIVTYAKTKQTYADYRRAGYSKKFRATHESAILLCQEAKDAFDKLGYGKTKKLPAVASLRAEYAAALDEKRQLYADYKAARTEMRELTVARENVDRLLNPHDVGRKRERGDIER